MSDPTRSGGPVEPATFANEPAPLAAPPSSERSRATFLDRVHFVLLRAVGTDCSLFEVSASRYTQLSPLWPPLNEDVLRGLGEEHRTVVAAYLDGVESDAKTRYDRVDSKLRTLLGVNGLAFSLITGFSLGGKPLFLVASAPFIISSVLALRALGIHTFQVLSLSNQEVSLGLAELHAIQLRGRLAAANENECVVDFIVDCFRAAHRYFVLALIMLPLLYLGGLALEHKDAPPIVVNIGAIAPSAAGVLRGAPGPRGDAGPRGPEGQQGPPGPTGPAGSAPAPQPLTVATLSTASALPRPPTIGSGAPPPVATPTP